MIRITLGSLVNASPILDDLAKVRRSAVASYALSRLIKQVREEVQHFTTEREALIKELGEEHDPTPQEIQRGQTGRLTSVKPTLIPEFIRRVTELAAVPIEIADRWLLTPAFLAEDRLSGEDVLALGDLLVPPPDPPPAAEVV